MLDLKTFNRSLKFTWIQKYLSCQSNAKWKTFFDYRLKRYGGPFLFSSNIRKEDIKHLNIPDQSANEILELWAEIHRIKQWLRNGRSACHVSIQLASGPLLVISIGLQHLFLWSGRFKLFKSGVRVTIYAIYIPCVRYWAFVVTQRATKYQQRVRASSFCHKRSL